MVCGSVRYPFCHRPLPGRYVAVSLINPERVAPTPHLPNTTRSKVTGIGEDGASGPRASTNYVLRSVRQTGVLEGSGVGVGVVNGNAHATIPKECMAMGHSSELACMYNKHDSETSGYEGKGTMERNSRPGSHLRGAFLMWCGRK